MLPLLILDAGLTDVSVGTDASASAYFTAPTGCSFVKLPNYVDVTSASAGVAANANLLQNISSVSPLVNLPGTDGDSSYVFAAQILGAAAAGDVSLPAGTLAIHGFTDSASGTLNVGGAVDITLANIGIACDAAASPTTSGNIAITYQEPDDTTVKILFDGLTDGATFNVATYTAAAGKLEAIIAGDSTGFTSAVAEDAQGSTLVSGDITSTATTLLLVLVKLLLVVLAQLSILMLS